MLIGAYNPMLRPIHVFRPSSYPTATWPTRCDDLGHEYTCRAAGDPHYRSFDGKLYDFMGGVRGRCMLDRLAALLVFAWYRNRWPPEFVVQLSAVRTLVLCDLETYLLWVG